MSTFEEVVHDAATATRFIEWCVAEIGPGFHPDTSFADYVAVETSEPLFDQSAAANLEEQLERAFEFCDPYQVGLRFLRGSISSSHAPFAK